MCLTRPALISRLLSQPPFTAFSNDLFTLSFFTTFFHDRLLQSTSRITFSALRGLRAPVTDNNHFGNSLSIQGCDRPGWSQSSMKGLTPGRVASALIIRPPNRARLVTQMLAPRCTSLGHTPIMQITFSRAPCQSTYFTTVLRGLVCRVNAQKNWLQ